MARALAAGFLAACAACSLLTSVDGLSGGAAERDAAGSDASGDGPGANADATDALVTNDGAAGDGSTAGDGGPDASVPVELHPNGTFEDGLAPWGAYHGTVALDATARTGTKSLRPCAQPNPPADNIFSGDDQGAVPNPVIGATYHASIWVRADPAASMAPSGVLLLFRTIQLPNFAEVEVKTTTPVTLDATWKKLEIDLPVTMPAKALNIAVIGQHAAGACFLVDDVSVVRIQ
jgi:hypothetical protein